MTCPKCNTEFENQVNFCSNCGAKLNKKRPRAKALKYLLCAVIVVVIVICVATSISPEIGSEGLEYELNEDGKGYTVIDIGTCTDTKIVIPSQYNGLPVTHIGGYAFYKEDELISVVIPNSVIEIVGSAFAECANLEEVKLSNNLQVIGSYAFWECSSLKSIKIPKGVTTVSHYAFAWCTQMEEISIPNTITYIGEGAFFIRSDGLKVFFSGTIDEWAHNFPSSFESSHNEVHCSNGIY